MTKRFFFLEFFIIFLFFILPPLAAPFLNADVQIFDFTGFSTGTAACLALGIFLVLQEKQASKVFNAQEADPVSDKSFARLKRILNTAEFLKTFGVLCAAAAAIEAAGFLLKIKNSVQIVFPETPSDFFFCALTVSSAAFYEEAVFRAWLPFAMNYVFKKFRRFSEIVPVVLFALSHAGGGIPAVLNALAAGFFLRRCAVKTRGIRTGFCAHLVYNILNLIVLSAV